MPKGFSKKEISKLDVEPSVSYRKSRGEHYKDIVIAVLVTAVVAFVAGSVYANNQSKVTAEAVQQAKAQAETVKK